MKSGWRGCAVAMVVPVMAMATTGTWQNFTSMKEVRAVASDQGAYWAATSGGLFRWSPADNSFLLITNAEGLRTIDLTAVALDTLGDIWTGGSNGILHAYTPSTGRVRTILDIAGANQTNKNINAITITGDTALICTEFGLSLYRISRGEFGDTFSRFGSIPAGTRTAVSAAAIHNGKLWACISDGQTVNRIAVADLSVPNLLPPESWTLLEVGSPGNVPRTLAVFSGRLYAGTAAGLYSETGGTWNPVSGLSGKSIVALSASSTTLLAGTSDRLVYTMDAAQTVTTLPSAVPSAITSLAQGSQGGVIVGSVDSGLLTSGTVWGTHIPNGPNSNQFLNIVADPDGVIWCGSGDFTGKGLYRYDGANWITFTRENSALPANEVYRMSVGCNGTVWASTYGRGIVALPRGSTAIDSAFVYGRNVGMIGVSGDTNYVVVSNAVCDSHGNTWMSVVLAANRNVFIVRKADGTWAFFPALIGGITMASLMDRPVDRCLAVDAFDNIWATVRDAAYRGVISLGNAGAMDSTAAFHITSSNGLPSNEVKTIVVDRDNDVWVGTDRGIAIILEPSNPTRTGAIAAYKPLNGLVINTIAVDPLNQKWVGTTEGVFLLSPDGTQTMASYTVENTAGKLIDNDVKSICVDGKTGTVYFGTLVGLASLTTSAASPRASFDGLSVYPNPYLVPSGEAVTISGLVANSSLKILSVDGRVIRDLRTPGGLVGTWDGKDKNGEFVSSGVYLVVAYAEDGSTVTSGKVAIIKR